ncbi:MAG: M16 family metallopeptidase [Armatimonadota bacterium]
MRRGIRAGLIVLAVVSAAAAHGAPIARAVLDNGLTVLAVRAEHTQIAGIGIVLGVSIADEPDGLHGARAMLQQFIVVDSHAQINEERSPVSAFINPRSSGLAVNTDWEFVEIALAIHEEELGAGLAALRRHVFAAEITPERLEETRGLVQRGYDIAHHSPVQDTFELFRAAFYGDHPMARSPQGTPESIAAITLEDLRAFRDSHYVPANAVLCLVAPVPTDAAIAAASAAFGDLPARPAPTSPDLPAGPSESKVEVGESPALVQASLAVGVPLPPCDDPRYLAGEMIAELLDGRGGRLRRDLGLLQALALAIPARLLEDHYPVGVLPIPMARRPFLAVHALTSPHTIEQTRRGLLRHLLALRTGGVTDAELARARERLVNAHTLRQERPVEAAIYLARRELFGLGGSEEATAAIEAITPEDLSAVANEYFIRHAVGVQMPAVTGGVPDDRGRPDQASYPAR